MNINHFMAALSLPLVAGSAAAVILTVQMGVVELPTNGEGISLHRPHSKGSPASIMGKHDCWSGNDAPAGVIPGHAVIRRTPASDAEYVGGRDAAIALDQELLGRKPVFDVVYGFCR